MAFEPVFEITKLEALKRLCSAQAVVEAKILPVSETTIARVLSIATDCSVAPSEVFAGEARYNGRVCFKMIYVDANGQNHNLDYNADFTDKIVCEQINSGLKPMLSAVILDTDIVNVSEREIKLACVMEISADAVIEENPNILMKGGENVYTHEDKIDYTRMVCECGETFNLGDSMQDVKCATVLLSEPKMVINRLKCGNDNIIAEGKVICDVCGETEDGMIVSFQQVTSFVQEIAASNSRDNCFAIGSAFISSYKVVMESNDSSNAILFDYNINFTAKVFVEDSCSPVVDAFSITNELLQAGESIKIFKNKFCACFNDRVDGSVTLDINMPIADNILAVTGSKLNIASAIAKDGKIGFEGAATCNIIYYSQDTNSKNSVNVELPFSFNVNSNVEESDEVSAKGIITKVITKIRRGNEIDIKAEIEIEVIVSSSETKYIITELKIGEERALPTSAFSIHIAKNGENLWDVAKALGITPEMVLSQNPKLTLPLSGGERILAYRNLK